MADLLRGFRAMLDRLSGAHEQAPWPGRPRRASLWTALKEQTRSLADVVSGDVVSGDVDFGGDGRDRAQLAPGGADATCVQHALGAALAGERAVSLLREPDDAGACLTALDGATRPAVPLTAALMWPARGAGVSDGHDPLWQAGAGAPLCVAPARAQRALDWQLVLLRACEWALCPGVLVVDAGFGRAPAGLTMAEDGLLSAYLGRSDDILDTPTAAQQWRFGTHRRSVPRAVDAVEPRAIGMQPSEHERDAALVAQHQSLAEPREQLLRLAADTLGALTGRPLQPLLEHGPTSAPVTLVTLGAAFEVACAAAIRARRAGEPQLRVVGVEWVRPFPLEALARALAGARRVVVLERAPAAGQGGLLSRVQRALGPGAATQVHAATYGPTRERPRTADLVALCSRAAAGLLPAQVHLGVMAPVQGSAHPDRQAMLERHLHAHPRAAQEQVFAAAGADEGEPAAFAVLASDASASALSLSLHADGDASSARTVRWSAVEAGSWALQWTDDARSEPDGELSGLVVEGGELPAIEATLPRLRFGGWVVSGAPAVDARSPGCLRLFRERALRRIVVEADGDPEPLLRAGLALALGEPLPDGARELEPEHTPPPQPAPPSHRSPVLSRFWGELAGPRAAGELSQPVPEPRLALGSSPAGSAALAPPVAVAWQLPTVDVSACTGCGRCWTACPDGALLPRAWPTARLLSAALDACSPRGGRSPAVSSLARGLRTLAAAVDRRLVAEGRRVLDADLLRNLGAQLIDKLASTDDERAEQRGALEAIAVQLRSLEPMATPFFHGEGRAPDAPASLLVLGSDPQACQGCGLCEVECPEGAIRMAAASGVRTSDHGARLRALEALPNSDAAVIEGAAAQEQPGPAAALGLDRDAASALARVPAGRGPSVGSGPMLAARLLSAAAAQLRNGQRAALAARAGALAGDLRDRLRRQLADAVPLDDLPGLEGALADTGAGADAYSGLLARLRERGLHPRVDASLLSRRVGALQALDRADAPQAPPGSGGTLVIVPGAVDVELRYPDNPFAAAALWAPADAALPVAESLARQALRRGRERVRALREAALLVDPPADLPAALQACMEPPPSPEERAAIEPVMLWADAAWLGSVGVGPLLSALRSPWPLYITVFDPAPDPGAAAIAALQLVAQMRTAHLVSSSVARPDHLVGAVGAALTADSSALIHVAAPRSAPDGRDAAELLRRARNWIECGQHTLLSVGLEGAASTGAPDAGAPPPQPVPEQPEAEVAPGVAGPGAVEDAVRAADVERLHARLLELAGLELPEAGGEPSA